MTRPDPTVFARATWCKSSYSGGGNQCVEVAAADGVYAIRDSKNPTAGYLVVSGTQWKTFLARIKQGTHDIS
jgi:hypothetical protein